MQQHFNRIALAALFAGGLSGCSGEPEWVAAYEDCKTQMTNISEQMKERNSSSDEQNPHAQAMVDAMSNMAKSMGMAACESFKQICEPDPEGDACQAMVREYKKSKDKE